MTTEVWETLLSMSDDVVGIASLHGIDLLKEMMGFDDDQSIALLIEALVTHSVGLYNEPGHEGELEDIIEMATITHPTALRRVMLVSLSIMAAMMEYNVVIEKGNDQLVRKYEAMSKERDQLRAALSLAGERFGFVRNWFINTARRMRESGIAADANVLAGEAASCAGWADQITKLLDKTDLMKTWRDVAIAPDTQD